MMRGLALGMAGLTLLASAGAASACPFDKNAQTTAPTTTESSQLPLPTDTTKDTGSKTGG